MHQDNICSLKNCNTPNKFIQLILVTPFRSYQGIHGLQGILWSPSNSNKNQLLLLIISVVTILPYQVLLQPHPLPHPQNDKFLLLGYFMILPGWKLSKEKLKDVCGLKWSREWRTAKEEVTRIWKKMWIRGVKWVLRRDEWKLYAREGERILRAVTWSF